MSANLPKFCNVSDSILLKSYLLLYLFLSGRQGDKGTQRQRDCQSAILLLNCLQEPGLGQARARGPEHNPGLPNG